MAQPTTLFTPQQKEILDQLRHTRGSPIPMERLVWALYGHLVNGGPDDADNAASVQLCYLRRKLRALGVNILGVGYKPRGYMIDPNHVDRLEELLAKLPDMAIEEARTRLLGSARLDGLKNLLCDRCYAAIQQARESPRPGCRATPR